MTTLGLDVLRGEEQKPFNGQHFDVWITIDSDIVFTFEQVVNLIESTNSYTLPTGTVTISVTKNILTYYDWELETNESKRTINLLNERYVTELEKQFKNLMK
jgi:hypothetical protein